MPVTNKNGNTNNDKDRSEFKATDTIFDTKLVNDNGRYINFDLIRGAQDKVNVSIDLDKDTIKNELYLSKNLLPSDTAPKLSNNLSDPDWRVWFYDEAVTELFKCVNPEELLIDVNGYLYRSIDYKPIDIVISNIHLRHIEDPIHQYKLSCVARIDTAKQALKFAIVYAGEEITRILEDEWVTDRPTNAPIVNYGKEMEQFAKLPIGTPSNNPIISIKALLTGGLFRKFIDRLTPTNVEDVDDDRWIQISQVHLGKSERELVYNSKADACSDYVGWEDCDAVAYLYGGDIISTDYPKNSQEYVCHYTRIYQKCTDAVVTTLKNFGVYDNISDKVFGNSRCVLSMLSDNGKRVPIEFSYVDKKIGTVYFNAIINIACDRVDYEIIAIDKNSTELVNIAY